MQLAIKAIEHNPKLADLEQTSLTIQLCGIRDNIIVKENEHEEDNS
jgi:hypothetical protein